jgi:hypothetical protein
MFSRPIQNAQNRQAAAPVNYTPPQPVNNQFYIIDVDVYPVEPLNDNPHGGPIFYHTSIIPPSNFPIVDIE